MMYLELLITYSNRLPLPNCVLLISVIKVQPHPLQENLLIFSNYYSEKGEEYKMLLTMDEYKRKHTNRE